MKEEKNELKKQVRVLLRFSGKNVSLAMPHSWTLKKLKNFINYAFKDDIKNNKILIYHGGKILSNENLILSTLFKEDLNQLIVTLKSKDDSTADNRKSSLELLISSNPENKKEVIMTSDDFEKLELYLYHCYSDVLISNSACANSDLEMVSKLPLMHKNFDNRVKAANEKSKLTLTDIWDPDNIDNYAIGDYFKIDVFFKLFLFFILFGAHIKGYNIPFFISLLVLYYWYSLYIDINQYYKKKMDEIKLTEEEMTELKFLDSEAEEEKSEEEEEEAIEEVPQNIGAIQTAEKDTNKLLEEKENMKTDLDDIQIENVDFKVKEINTKDENLKEISNVIPLQEKEPRDISHLFAKIEAKKAKKAAKEQKREGTLSYKYFSLIFSYYFTFALESIQVFVMSLFPMWCDEYEISNPIIARLLHQVANPNTNANIPINAENVSQDINNPNTQFIENENENELHDNYNPQEVEMKHLNEKANANEFKSQISEKILIKSSNDTRLVNPSECQNKYFLVEENENKTENEYVFSENVNIDTLSYNEPIIESLKKKQEREIEDEGEASMQNNK